MTLSISMLNAMNTYASTWQVYTVQMLTVRQLQIIPRAVRGTEECRAGEGQQKMLLCSALLCSTQSTAELMCEKCSAHSKR
jgi:hypothetical protein